MKKFGNFMAWFGVFIMSLAGIVYIISSRFYPVFLEGTFLARIGMSTLKFYVLIIAILYVVICVKKFFGIFKRNHDYHIKTENGVIVVTSGSVKSLTKSALNGVEDINVKNIIITQKRGALHVQVILAVDSKANVSDKIIMLQQKIKDSIKNVIGIEAKKIEIKIADFSEVKLVQESK